MPSPCNRREFSSVKVNKSSSLNLSLIVCATLFSLVAAMLVLTRIGRADAGIGQPVTLGPPQHLPVGLGPVSITSYGNDFSNPALAIANSASDSVSIIQKQTSFGDFEPAVNYSLPAGAQPQSVAVGTRFTFSGSQKFVAVADTGINKVSVLLRQSINTFQQPVNYDVGTTPQDLAVGQIVGDSNNDIVTANFGSDNVTVLTGNADGTFGNAVSFAAGSKPRAVALGTIDNNSSTDIVTCNSGPVPGQVNLLKAGSGAFLAPVPFDVGTDPVDIAVADLNQDGKLDVVTANHGSNDVSILLNNGNGGFSQSIQYPAGQNPHSVAVADFNLDGKPDLAVASVGDGLNLLLNNGDGTFAQPLNFSMGPGPSGVAVGLFNLDGLPDVVTANGGGTGTISIRLNTTALLLTFATPSPTPVNSKPHSIATFNRFGRAGLAVTDNDAGNSRVSVLYKSNNSFPNFFDGPTHYPLIAGSQPEQVVVGNLGQIPLPSLVIALPNANKVGILLGNSDDLFQPPVYKDVGTFPRSIALGDFNSDGNLDIAAANFGSGTISMLLGNADRSFQNAFTVANAVSANPEFIVAGDFNNDGKADIATCSSGPPDHNKVNVLLGNGNGTFQPALTFTAGLNPQFMTTGDFNQDGKLDLAVSDGGENKVSVLLNTGGGVFQQPASYAVGAHPNSIVAVDFNLDGRTDLAVSNGESKTFSVLLNNGDGTFKASLSFVVGLGPIGITIADFNSDNKPDVVTANHDDGTISVVSNTTPQPPLPTPPNDNFANAAVLSGFSGTTQGTNIGATIETNEPFTFSSNSNSVWYSWTAPADGGVTIDTFESSFNTLLAVYTGSDLATLTTVVSNDNDLSPAGDARATSKVTFTAVSGTTYKIAVSSNGSPGNVTLNWTLLPPPANDNFANAETISGASGVVVHTNAGATKEPGEPNHADNPGGASLWYRWTAPSDGSFTFNTSASTISCDSDPNGCRYDTLLAVYVGDSLQQVSQPQNLVAKNDDESSQPKRVTSLVSFSATAGTTYRIAVDSKGNFKSKIALSWFSGVASHDSFATAVQISGFTGSSSSDAGSNGETWFRWVAPGSGAVKFSSGTFVSPTRASFAYPSTLSVFAVSGQTTTSILGSNTGSCVVSFADRFCDQSQVTFSAVGGSVYGIRIVKPSESIGSASLSWTSSAAPPVGPANDNFAAATIISGFGRGLNSVGINNTNATKEPGEPNHAGDPGGHSIWFNWTAPADFQVTFSAFATTGQTTLVGAYTGSTVSTLVSVAGASSAITFAAIKDTTYHIAVDSQLEGNGFLNWFPANAPPNDNLANAQPLNGSSGKVLGTNINATSEIGEPFHNGDSPSASIWYRWTAPNNGLFTFNTDGSDVGTRLAIYSGPAIGNLSLVISSTNRVTFFALAGQSYKIAIDGSQGGNIRLQWGAPRNIGGRITNIRGVGIANVVVSLDGDAKRTRNTDAQGFYNFSDVPEGGSYVVTPSIASYTYDVANYSYSPLTADVTNANFVALTPAYNIAGHIKAAGVAVANVTVNLTGTINTSTSTDSDGYYIFPDLTQGGNYTVMPSSQLFTFSAFSALKDRYFFPVLNASNAESDFTATATVPPLELLLEENAGTPGQAAAVDSVLMMRDPFPVVSGIPVLTGPDRNTRVLIFVTNLQLAAGETPAVIFVHLVDSKNVSYDVAAENLSTLPGFPFSQLTFRLPDGLASGTCTIEVRAHGQVSNSGTIRTQ